MIRQENRFPLVADNEVLVGENPVMSLYDESDLISNIRGPYQEKEFIRSVDSGRAVQSKPVMQTEDELLPPLFEVKPSHYSRKERLQNFTKSKSSPLKTQGQLAREQAREDLKRKRSATYLRDEKPAPAKVVVKPPVVPATEPVVGRLTRLADKLRQTDYILADMPAVYSLKKEDRGQEQAVKKNSYDFLKKSQVYNYPERRQQRDRQVAQELNLTHIEEE
ncbi:MULTISPECIES: hypothetical protein [Streptococcus]|uniref:ATP-binding protein n=1 Tax=Streptococcus ruminantium TaxID=1917441 RepID=A0A2Z5U4X1_9STRE|nr:MULTISPECIES: hypothetical protein [Streptococcus]MDQ8767041.1 hypothetical protein [Streptococcus ruminantium]MDQ8780016.1 hypothetical protein [Streptococcus ruminantium]MDQ8837701.1 hypothetical protein [Streptococcus ruminantium]QHF55194.1 hypothetical protein BZG42_07510 [Streptococcus sp. DAT741]BBA93153.1 hypothetical protein SR187_7750 [Streptococcus ruminantium]